MKRRNLRRASAILRDRLVALEPRLNSRRRIAAFIALTGASWRVMRQLAAR